MLNTLRKRYLSPKVAEAHYLPKVQCTSEATSTGLELQVSPTIVGRDLSPNEQLQIISNLFKEFCTTHKDIQIPSDFLPLTLAAMEQLKKTDRSNVVYQLSRAVGTKRTDESDTLLPCRRMTMGLIEHCVNFFNSTSMHGVSTLYLWRLTCFSRHVRFCSCYYPITIGSMSRRPQTVACVNV